MSDPNAGTTGPTPDPDTQALIAQLTAIETVEDSAAAYITAQNARLATLVAEANSLSDLKTAITAEIQRTTDHTAPLAAAIATTPAS